MFFIHDQYGPIVIWFGCKYGWTINVERSKGTNAIYKHDKSHQNEKYQFSKEELNYLENLLTKMGSICGEIPKTKFEELTPNAKEW